MIHEPLRIDVDLALREAVAPGVSSDELDGLVDMGRQCRSNRHGCTCWQDLADENERANIHELDIKSAIIDDGTRKIVPCLRISGRQRGDVSRSASRRSDESPVVLSGKTYGQTCGLRV